MAKRESSEVQFDPRFSRAFQPGYDPQVHHEAQSQLRMPAATNSVRPSSAPVAEEQGNPPEFAIESIFPQPESAEDAEDELPLAWWHRFNPWLVVLWVLGLVFCWSAWYLAQLMADGSIVALDGQQWSQYASFIYQTVMLGVPTLFVLGLATLTSTVVILAAKWKRR